MSRRKQARPRLCKRDEEEEDEEGDGTATGGEGTDDLEGVPAEKKLKLSDEAAESADVEVPATSGDAPSEPEVFRCETCGATFLDLVQFMDHRNNQCEPGMLLGGKPNDNNDVGHSHSLSLSRSDTPSSVDSSLSRDSADSFLDGLDPDQVPYSMGVDEDFPVPCQFCEKAFAKMAHLKVHEQTHSDLMPFSCGQCNRVFRHKRSRDRHAKMNCSSKMYKCGECGLSFSRSKLLDNHKKIHSPGEQFSCPICSLVFPTMAALMSHQNAHKPKSSAPSSSHGHAGGSQKSGGGCERGTVKCGSCGGAFFSEKELEAHSCPGGYGGSKKPMQCPHCSALCVGPIALALHMEHAHTPAGSGDTSKCPICYKSFLTIEELTSHMKVHEGTSSDIATASDIMITHADMPSMEFGTSLLTGAANGLCPTDILVCPYCLRDDFETIECLELHMQGVHSVKPTEVYTCNYCNAPYKNLYSLHEHMRAIHQSQPSMGIKYPCSKCGKEYPSIDSLQEHKKRSHHYKHKDTAYPCMQCPLTFLSTSLLQEHVRAVHATTPKGKENHDYPPTQKSPKSTGLPKPPKLTSAKQKDCFTLLNTESPTIINVPEPSHLLRHLKSPKKTNLHSPTGTIHHSPATAAVSSVSSASAAAAVAAATAAAVSHLHIPTSLAAASSAASEGRSPGGGELLKQEKITCEQCNASFTDLVTYQTHLKLHIDSVLGQFGCRQCGKLFLSEDQLESHISTHYLSLLTEFGCGTCSKSFDKPDELQKHLMDIHAHHLYRCSLCKEVFDSKVNIQVHFAIKHSNESKLYRCVACEVVFRTETEWQVHLRVTHLHIAKPYRCLFCKESFATEMDLQCHLATHNKPFKCSMCDESFLVEFLLDKHLQSVHSSEGVGAVSAGGSADRKTPQMTLNDSSDRVYASISIKEEKDPDTIKRESAPSTPSGASLYNNLQGSSSTGSHGNSSLLVASNGEVGGVYPSSSGGSLVWRSPDDLYRCNICDMKFSQVSGLQAHKMQDHGVRYSPLKSPYSPGGSSSPKHTPATPSWSPKQQGTPTTPSDTLASVYSTLLTQASPEILAGTGSAAEKSSKSILHEALKSTMSLPISLPESTSPSATFTEKLVSSFGEKLCLACPFCSQTFKCKADLEKHSKIHLNTGSQKCNICDEVFASSGILAEHKLTHCKIQQGNICVACKIPLRNEDQFYLHSQEHGFQGAVMQCIVCRQTLASLLELQMHGRHHFQTRTTFYTCCVCLKSFDTTDNLISKLNTSGRTYYLCRPCYQGENSHYPCNQCGLTFESQTALETHVATHKKSYQCIKCQESFHSEHEIQLHVASHMMKEGNMHECKLCFIILDSPAKLQTHLIEHTYKSAGHYLCPICGRSFDKSTDIQAHALEHGISARKYGCSHCSQKFFFSAELENHLYTHKEAIDHAAAAAASIPNQSLIIQPLQSQTLSEMLKKSPALPKGDDSLPDEDFNCSQCDQKFPSLMDLTSHTKKCQLNVQETTVQCSHCAATFANVALLQKHFFSTHTGPSKPGAKAKPTCMECGKECSTESNLLTHLNTHRKGSKHSCATCRKCFASSAALTAHQKSTCTFKPHECPICNKRFAKKHNKLEHMKSHNGGGEKIYPCPFCGKLFSGRAGVQEHMKIHKVGETASSAVGVEEAHTETSSGVSDETAPSRCHSDEEELSDPEKDGMKQEVTSTSNILEDSNTEEH